MVRARSPARSVHIDSGGSGADRQRTTSPGAPTWTVQIGTAGAVGSSCHVATRPDLDGVDRAPSNRDDVPSDPCRDCSPHRPRSSGARYRRRSPRSELPRLVARYVGRRGSSSRTGLATECRARNVSHRYWSTSADRHTWRLLVMRRRRSIPAGDVVVAGSSGGRRLGQSRRISKRPLSCAARAAMSPGSEVRISTGPPRTAACSAATATHASTAEAAATEARSSAARSAPCRSNAASSGTSRLADPAGPARRSSRPRP